MKNLNFTTRIYLGFTVLMVLMVTVALTGYWGLSTQRNSVSDMLRSEVQLNDLASEARYHLLSLRRFEKDSLINVGDAEAVTSYVAKWEKSFTRLQGSLNKAIKIRAIVISDIPVIMFSYRINGADAHEDNDTGTQWRVRRNGGANLAFG